MPDPERTKVLFRCLFAYSGGQPVPVFEADAEYAQYDETFTANATSEAALKVAVVRRLSGPEVDATDCPKALAAAYEMFINDGDVSGDRIEWVGLKTD
jgi:hypothetical protein